MVCSVGLGMLGVILFYIGLMKNVNNIVLNGWIFDCDLEVLLKRLVCLVNDVYCFVFFEVSDGVGVGVSIVFGVIVGMGIGGGVVVDGKLFGGINVIGGEWGYNLLLWLCGGEVDGLFCYCGK